MNKFTLELRDSLLDLDFENLVVKLSKPEFVEIAGQKLKPGRYGRAKGYAKAFLIVDADGSARYQNKHGDLSKKLTPSAFLTHWNAGMSTFLGEI